MSPINLILTVPLNRHFILLISIAVLLCSGCKSKADNKPASGPQNSVIQTLDSAAWRDSVFTHFPDTFTDFLQAYDLHGSRYNFYSEEINRFRETWAHIPKQKCIRKLIGLTSEANWEPDAAADLQYGLWDFNLNHKSEFYAILETCPESKIHNYFYFLFDGLNNERGRLFARLLPEPGEFPLVEKIMRKEFYLQNERWIQMMRGTDH